MEDDEDEDEDFFLLFVSDVVAAGSSLELCEVVEVSAPVSVADLLLEVAPVDPALVSSLPVVVDLWLLMLELVVDESGLLEGDA